MQGRVLSQTKGFLQLQESVSNAFYPIKGSKSAPLDRQKYIKYQLFGYALKV